jgi:hypothetical protein
MTIPRGVRNDGGYRFLLFLSFRPGILNNRVLNHSGTIVLWATRSTAQIIGDFDYDYIDGLRHVNSATSAVLPITTRNLKMQGSRNPDSEPPTSAPLSIPQDSNVQVPYILTVGGFIAILQVEDVYRVPNLGFIRSHSHCHTFSRRLLPPILCPG